MRLSYTSLFSSAGIGCFGLQEAGMTCLASAEIDPDRLAIQRLNGIDGTIAGDLNDPQVKDQVCEAGQPTVVLATPPCQGISLANHYRQPDEARNSLVLAALEIIDRLRPPFFILENVRGFLTAACSSGGIARTIGEAIDDLAGDYRDARQVVNLADYGSASSRTRTLVIAARRDLGIDPAALLVPVQRRTSLEETIGDLPRLTEMNEVDPGDPLHRFRAYPARMRAWIETLQPGQSAFEHTDPQRYPHRMVDGIYTPNKASNANKYERARWDRIGPCVHTRNDILSSQTTIHPSDDRVFSIRELMRMMTVPDHFRWPDQPQPGQPVENFYQNERLIRTCLGEAVPTAVLRNIGMGIVTLCQEKGWDNG